MSRTGHELEIHLPKVVQSPLQPIFSKNTLDSIAQAIGLSCYRPDDVSSPAWLTRESII